MSKEEIALIITQYAIKFGLDAAIALAKAIQGGGNIDTVIAALEVAKTKTAQQYLDEERAAQALAAAGALSPTP